MLSRADGTQRAREIRALLKDYIDRIQTRDMNRVHALPRELVQAHQQLEILVKLETPAEQQKQGQKAS